MRALPENASPFRPVSLCFTVSRSLAILCASAALTAPAHADCVGGGCTDYSSRLSDACDSCTSSCDSLIATGSDCGVCATPVLAKVLDFVFGGQCECGGSGGGCLECAGSGCGDNFWNKLCSGQGDGCGVTGPTPGLTSMLASGRCGLGCGDCEPGAGYVGYREPPIFCGMPAPTYPVPFAVPKHVGYTQFTYPPFMPHHSLPHYRHTYSYRHAPGMSRTTVHWRPTVGRNILAKLHHIIELPR